MSSCLHALVFGKSEHILRLFCETLEVIDERNTLGRVLTGAFLNIMVDMLWRHTESIPYQHEWICLHTKALKASGRMSLIISRYWSGTLNGACFLRCDSCIDSLLFLYPKIRENQSISPLNTGHMNQIT